MANTGSGSNGAGFYRTLNIIVVSAAVLSACGAFVEPPVQICPSPESSSAQQGPSRIDTPWRSMSDAELAAKVAEADGKVFIGFKDSGAAAGVDEQGRVLASPASVAAGKAQLQALGIVIVFEFVDMPTVVAQMPATLVTEVRHNTLVDYIEPIFPGVRNAQNCPFMVP